MLDTLNHSVSSPVAHFDFWRGCVLRRGGVRTRAHMGVCGGRAPGVQYTLARAASTFGSHKAQSQPAEVEVDTPWTQRA